MTRPTAWYAPDPGALLNGPFRLTGIDSAQPRLQLHILTLHIRAQNPTAYPLSVPTPRLENFGASYIELPNWQQETDIGWLMLTS